MSAFRRILLILDSSLSRTPALERAVALTKATKAELWIGLFDAGPGLGIWGALDRNEARRLEGLMRDQESARLLDLVRSLREYDHVSVQMIDERSRPSAERIVAEVASKQFDLVIKDVGHDSTLRRLIFVPLDWELLRTSAVPVWLVAAASKGLPHRVAVALDPVHPEHGAGELNEAIIAAAQAIAAPGRAQLRLLSAFAGLPSELMALDPYASGLAFPNEELEQRLRVAHRGAFHGLIARHGLHTDGVEILYGPPVECVLDAVSIFHPDILVVGTLRRHGLDRLFMGSTAERLVGRAPCDVLVVPASAAVTEAIAEQPLAGVVI